MQKMRIIRNTDERRRAGVHLGCHDSGAAAKQACEDHLAQQERRHGS